MKVLIQRPSRRRRRHQERFRGSSVTLTMSLREAGRIGLFRFLKDAGYAPVMGEPEWVPVPKPIGDA